MAVDGNLIGTTAAKLMEDLEERYGADVDAEAVEVMVIVVVQSDKEYEDLEVNNESNDPEQEGYSYIHARSSDPIPHHKVGLLTTLLQMESIT